MAYFIFSKNSPDIIGTIYRIAENQSDLNNLNINISDYEIIEDSQSNFNLVKLGNKFIEKYNNNIITYTDLTFSFNDKNNLQNYVNNFKQQIKQFTDNNPNHLLLNQWNNYFNQLNSLDLNTIIYPLNKSLEQYFNDLGQPSYNILQLP
jgi:hypothetical protein